MGKLTLTAFVTLDGVHQAPGGPQEDPSGGFEQGGWSVPFGDDDFGAFVVENFGRVGAFLLGRRTYDIFASYWPKRTDPADPIATKLNALPKYVASRTLTDAAWQHTTVLGGDLVKEVEQLKERTDDEVQRVVPEGAQVHRRHGGGKRVHRTGEIRPVARGVLPHRVSGCRGVEVESHRTHPRAADLPSVPPVGLEPTLQRF